MSDRQLADEKLFYERFYALHRDDLMRAVFERFGIAPFRRSSVLEGFVAFLRSQEFYGRACVEIGTCAGLTSLALARNFHTVHTIDIVKHPQRDEIAEFAGARNIVAHVVRDNAEKAELIRSLDFDAAYVDGDHAHDTEGDFALVERCGRVLFHEHWDAQPPVVRLVNRLRARGRVVTEGKLALWIA